MAKERPEGILEKMLVCLENMETHLGLLSKNPGLGKTAAQTPAASATPAATTASKPAATAGVPTTEDIRDALRVVSEAFGRERAIELLKEKKYKNATAVPEGERAEFLAYIQENSKPAEETGDF